jgi:hypothetical protein
LLIAKRDFRLITQFLRRAMRASTREKLSSIKKCFVSQFFVGAPLQAMPFNRKLLNEAILLKLFSILVCDNKKRRNFSEK